MKLIRRVNFVFLLGALVSLIALVMLVLINSGKGLEWMLKNAGPVVGVAFGVMLMFLVTTFFLCVYTVVGLAKEGRAGVFLKDYVVSAIFIFVFVTVFNKLLHHEINLVQNAVLAMIVPIFNLYGKINQFVKEKEK